MSKEETRGRNPLEGLRLVLSPKEKATSNTGHTSPDEGDFAVEEWFSESGFGPNPLFYEFEDPVPYLRAICRLLRMIEETWTPVDHDTLTDVEERTLVWMTLSYFDRKFREIKEPKASIREYRLSMFGRYGKSLLSSGRESEMCDDVLRCEPEKVSSRREFISDQMHLL